MDFEVISPSNVHVLKSLFIQMMMKMRMRCQHGQEGRSKLGMVKMVKRKMVR
jgi:hypothetical protein